VVEHLSLFPVNQGGSKLVDRHPGKIAQQQSKQILKDRKESEPRVRYSRKFYWWNVCKEEKKR
jgi:hypothetical protein